MKTPGATGPCTARGPHGRGSPITHSTFPTPLVAYVGDKYALDAVGAHEAGLHAYWLDRAHTSRNTAISNGIRVIHSLDELPAALTS